MQAPLPKGILIKKLIVTELATPISAEILEVLGSTHELILQVELSTVGKILDKKIKAFHAVKVIELVVSTASVT